MNETNFNELETLFLALGDKTRLRLLALMADGEVAVGFLAERLGESQPKVSRHLAYLRNAGVVNTRRDGKWIYYGIHYPEDASLKRVLETVVRSIPVMKVDGEYVYFTDEETFAVETTDSESEIYAETHVYEVEDNYEEDIEEDIVNGQYRDPEEMDVFLL